jgi:hypothetical protein
MHYETIQTIYKFTSCTKFCNMFRIITIKIYSSAQMTILSILHKAIGGLI